MLSPPALQSPRIGCNVSWAIRFFGLSFGIVGSYIFVFSRMRSKVSRFTLGVWGLRVCSLDVAFTVATVRNRSRDPRMAVPMGKFCRGGHFWRCQACRCFVSRGRRGTS